LIGIEEPETALHPGAFAALREALRRAAEQKQVLITSHSAELLDDPELPVGALLAVVSEAGETRIAAVDSASSRMLEDRLFTAGELLRLNQLAPDQGFLAARDRLQMGLFAERLPPSAFLLRGRPLEDGGPSEQ
jgi:hypothetical protein